MFFPLIVLLDQVLFLTLLSDKRLLNYKKTTTQHMPMNKNVIHNGNSDLTVKF